jgi:branched-chain amino acid transport system ATP-binding protein
MGFVPEGVSGLFPTLTIRQNLAAVRPAANENSAAWQTMEDHIRELFGEVLVNKVDNVAGSMSGGQRQMLAIAMALRRRPSLLLLDEPSTGLAPIVVERILRVVETLVKTTSASVVLVEQNFANALRVSSRTVIVQSGRVKAELTHDQFPEPTELWRYF